MDQQAYRDKLRQRQQQEHADKGKTGLGRKTVLDYSKAAGKVVNLFEPKYKPAENAFDIIPFVTTQSWYKNLKTPSGRLNGLETGDLEYKLQIPVHKDVGVNHDMFLCPREAFGDSCALCDEMFAAYQAGDKDKAAELRPKWKTFYNVYDYDDPDKGIQIFDISYYLFESTTKNDSQRTNLIDVMNLDDRGPVPFYDLLEGKIIVAKFKKKTFGKAEFPEVDDIQFEDRSQPYDDEVLERVFPLDSMLIIPSNEEMKNAYYAIEEEKKDAGEPEPERSEPARSRTRTMPEENKKEEAPPPETTRRRVEEPVDEKAPDPSNPCPAGKIFGQDFNTGKDCEGATKNSCDEATFDRCSKAHAEFKSGRKIEEKKEELPPPVEEKKQEATQEPPTERRRRR